MEDELRTILDELEVEMGMNKEFDLEAWAMKYPEYANEMREYALFSIAVDAAQATQAIRTSEQVASRKPLASIIAAAEAVGLNQAQLAWLLGIGRATLAKLERRTIAVQTVPRAVVRRLSEQIGYSMDDVRAFLGAGGTQTAALSFLADVAPVAGGAQRRSSFLEAVDADPEIAEEQKAAWRSDLMGTDDGALADA